MSTESAINANTTIIETEIIGGDICLVPDADGNFVIGVPEGGTRQAVAIEASQNYILDFSSKEIASSYEQDGSYVIEFNNGATIVLENAQGAIDGTSGEGDSEGTTLTLANGEVVNPDGLLEALAKNTQPAENLLEQPQTEVRTFAAITEEEAAANASIEPAAGDLTAVEAAAIEPEAGGEGIGNSGAQFESFEPTPINGVNAVGPLDPTALQFGIPQVNVDVDPISAPASSSSVLDPDVEVGNQSTFEDVGQEIVFGASPATADGLLTISITGIPAGSTIDTTSSGGTITVDPTNPNFLIWTRTSTTPGLGFQTGDAPTITPPADSDVDIPLNLVASETDPAGNPVGVEVTDSFTLVVDAVADDPDVDGLDNTVGEGDPNPVNITGLTGEQVNAAPNAPDGSETITGYQISGVPTGFTFTDAAGNAVGTNLGGGIWSFAPAQITGLQLVPNDPNFVGSVPLTVTIFTQENPTDLEITTNNNTAQDSDQFTLTWVDDPLDPPVVTVNPPGDPNNPLGTNLATGGRVSEDDSVTVEVNANFGGTPGPTDVLTVTVTGIPSGVGFTFNNGSFNAATGTWTFTGPAATAIQELLTFTPPADSGVDLTGLQATVTVTDGNNQSQDGNTQDFIIIVDDVADQAVINVNNTTTGEGDPASIAINAQTGEAANAIPGDDGSESITSYQISGVPTGFTFTDAAGNAVGTNLGGGVWSFTPAQITGLQLQPTANFVGTVSLTATVFTTDNTGDLEFDNTNNQSQASDTFTVIFTPDPLDPPVVTVNPPGDPNNPLGTNLATGGRVSEDDSVTVEVNANFGGTPGPTDVLTVTVTGIPSGVGFTFNNGSFNAATGTWTFTGPAATAIQELLTFTPPADSDVDLTGLQATVTVTDGNNQSQDGNAQDFIIIVDAVADDPTINANNRSGDEGQPVALSINAQTGEAANAIPGDDGSETITGYQISGVPTGFSFINGAGAPVGTNLGGGVWSFTPAQIVGLQLQPTAGFNGTVNLTATVFTQDGPTDLEFNNNNNQGQASDAFTITFNSVLPPPTVTVNPPGDPNNPLGTNLATGGRVSEDGSVQVEVNAGFGGTPGPGEFLTVTITGIGLPASNFAFSAGSYNPSLNGGTWTFQAPAGQPIQELLTFTPLADSDIDLTGMQATVTVTDPNSNTSTDGNSQDFIIVVDAVADTPVIDAQGSTGTENTVLSIDILNAQTGEAANAIPGDDGSESITGYQISNVPTGFSFEDSAGNSIGTNLGGGVWSFTPAEITDVQIQSTPDFVGTITLDVTVFTQDGPTDLEFNTTNNQGQATDTISVTWEAQPDGVLKVGSNDNDQGTTTTPYIVGAGTGEINGTARNDILVGDDGGTCDVDIGRDHNLLFIIDNSNSMGDPNDPFSNFSLMIEAIQDQISQISTFYDAGRVVVHFAPFNSTSGVGGTFEITDFNGLLAARNYLDNLTTDGFTNFEAGLQSGIDWIQNSGELIPGGETTTFFMSDGEPNRYLDAAGNAVSASSSVIIDEITGGDGTDEVGTIQSLSNVIGVGINAGADDTAEIELIDSDGNIINIDDSDDFSIVLNGVNIITKLNPSGCDTINGGAGDDLIFGDVLFTDTLATAQGIAAEPGTGWDVFARLENGEGLDPTWDRQDTIDYIRANFMELAQESIDAQGDPRGVGFIDAGHDILNGGSGDDIIFGQEGRDVITGGSGDDFLVGGSGGDVFTYTSGDNGMDTIADFVVGEDVLDISDILVGFDPLNDDIADFVSATTVNGNTIISVDANGSTGGNNFVQIATLEGVTGVNVAEITNNGETTVV